ncbi:MAG: hypothetical protein ACAI35_25925 [Candidatus Methylacidiphilales bacterium]|nr:hypothetical protein [Candidatus Methylacidiphilales bacterium]
MKVKQSFLSWPVIAGAIISALVALILIYRQTHTISSNSSTFSYQFKNQVPQLKQEQLYADSRNSSLKLYLYYHGKPEDLYDYWSEINVKNNMIQHSLDFNGAIFRSQNHDYDIHTTYAKPEWTPTEKELRQRAMKEDSVSAATALHTMYSAKEKDSEEAKFWAEILRKNLIIARKCREIVELTEAQMRELKDKADVEAIENKSYDARRTYETTLRIHRQIFPIPTP